MGSFFNQWISLYLGKKNEDPSEWIYAPCLQSQLFLTQIISPILCHSLGLRLCGHFCFMLCLHFRQFSLLINADGIV